MKKKLFLVCKTNYVVDEVGGDGIVPLWVCSDEELAEKDVERLKSDFHDSSVRLGLTYRVVYFYQVINYYESC